MQLIRGTTILTFQITGHNLKNVCPISKLQRQIQSRDPSVFHDTKFEIITTTCRKTCLYFNGCGLKLTSYYQLKNIKTKGDTKLN